MRGGGWTMLSRPIKCVYVGGGWGCRGEENSPNENLKFECRCYAVICNQCLMSFSNWNIPGGPLLHMTYLVRTGMGAAGVSKTSFLSFKRNTDLGVISLGGGGGG